MHTDTDPSVQSICSLLILDTVFSKDFLSDLNIYPSVTSAKLVKTIDKKAIKKQNVRDDLTLKKSVCLEKSESALIKRTSMN